MSKIRYYGSALFLRSIGLCALAVSFLYWNKAESQNTATYSEADYIANFYTTLKTKGGIGGNNINRKGLVKVFCQIILNSSLSDGFFQKDVNGNPGDYRYSPKQSLFVYLLCNSLADKDLTNIYQATNHSSLIQSYTAQINEIDILMEENKNNFETLETLNSQRQIVSNLLQQETDHPGSSGIGSDYLGERGGFLKKRSLKEASSGSNCSRSSNMNDCPFSTYASKVFHQIINDYTNSKIANIYGSYAALGSTQELKETQIHSGIINFSNYFYSKCGDAEGSSEQLYINKESIDKSEKAYCSHPNTYKVLSNFIEQSYNKTKKNTIVDYDLLLSDKSKTLFLTDALITNCSETNQANTLDCSLKKYRHLVLNELMFYSMFMQFYAHYVSSSEQFGPISIGKDKVYTKEVIEEEARKADIELQIATNTIQQDFKIIRNLFAKFPVHIALVAYLEDLVNFRNTLVKLYTPVHQMYYKLRNAQTYER